MESAPAELGEGEGTLRVEFEEGDLFLEDRTGRAFRVSWTADELGEERVRALPAGEYRLRTYRIVREEADALWHVSVTAPAIREVVVYENDETLVELDDRIHQEGRLAGGQVSLRLLGADGAGLSVYREGRRVPVEFRVLDPGGGALAAGSMEYG